MFFVNATGITADLDGLVLAMTCLTTYALFISTIALCASTAGRRLHEYAAECALEHHRHADQVDRLLLLLLDAQKNEEEDSTSCSSAEPDVDDQMSPSAAAEKDGAASQ